MGSRWIIFSLSQSYAAMLLRICELPLPVSIEVFSKIQYAHLGSTQVAKDRSYVFWDSVYEYFEWAGNEDYLAWRMNFWRAVISIDRSLLLAQAQVEYWNRQ